ncbi:MAG: hypothetical protein OEV70_13575, partial [Nitrospirota bacterium]|nr:hypothetical protein [Nitrospirota bacterium]
DGEANHIRPERYHIPVESQSEGRWVADWRPMISDIIRDMSERLSPSVIALGFHHALAKLISNIAERMTCTQIILSGGVFQNSVLLRLSENEFIQQGIPVYSPHLFGTNDGGLSLGQCLVAVHTFTKYPTQKKKERLPVHRKQA